MSLHNAVSLLIVSLSCSGAQTRVLSSSCKIYCDCKTYWNHL